MDERGARLSAGVALFAHGAATASDDEPNDGGDEPANAATRARRRARDDLLAELCARGFAPSQPSQHDIANPLGDNSRGSNGGDASAGDDGAALVATWDVRQRSCL